MKVPFKREKETVKEPLQASNDAGAWDIYADEIEDKGDGRVWVKTNLAVAVPKGYRLMLQARSSITKSTFQLQNSVGLIDADFRQGIQARFITAPTGITREECWSVERGDYEEHIFEYPHFPHKVGERIGQVYLEKVEPIEWVEVDELDETDRKGGFGSTGNK